MKWESSEKQFEEAQKYIPGGVNSPVRSFANVDRAPVFVESGKGSHIIDVDGNEYIDYISSWGPLILGHQNPIAKKALLEAADKGFSFGLPTVIETEVAKIVVDAYPGIDEVRMVSSGTEATMSALRVARGYTHRDKIIKFEGCYHGHNDALLVKSGSGTLTFGMPTSPGIPNDITKNTLVCRYNDIEHVKKTILANINEIAAIIIEPIAANMGLVEADASFLKELRNLCDEHGIVLIFDEVITGFRMAFGGAAQWYGITPDMACFGKIIGGGLPVGAYGGTRAIMDCVTPKGNVYQAGTLSGNPLAMYVGSAQLTYLKEHPEIYGQLEEKTRKLANAFQTILENHHLPYQVAQTGSLMTVFFTDKKPHNFDDVNTCDTKQFALFFKKMMEKGIMMSPSQYEVLFLNTCHSEEDLQRTIQAFEETIQEMYA